IVAMGLETMLAPNGLVDGGVTALSIMANALWGIPIYFVFLGLNIPILSRCVYHIQPSLP
ncbi:YitT family protein, partial [Priestia megaterium]|uniref:YitT family protein n=1 Tax=Priestia megaterium TaxID=1404 RepID=UPI00249CAB2D